MRMTSSHSCWMASIAMFIVLTYSLTCNCFTHTARSFSLFRSQQLFSSTPSYESMLERAQAMKKLTSQPPAPSQVATKPEISKNNNNNNNKATSKKSWTSATQKSTGVEEKNVNTVVSSSSPPPVVAAAAAASPVPWTGSKPVEEMTAREKASFKNKVPFSEEIYEVLKTAIELLSTRINEPDKKLTVEESEWLLQAVEVILDDAKRFGPPPKPESKPK